MRPHIAVVGAGFSGTLAALQLLRHCAPWVGVTLIERAANSAGGALPAVAVADVRPTEIDEALGWQTTRLVFSNTALEEVVASFNRFNRHQLTIGDPKLRTRTLTGEMGPFKKGGFHLAINTGAEILPFTISGCYERFTPGDWRITPGTVTLEWGEAIPTEGYSKETMEALMDRVKTAIGARFQGLEAVR